MERLVGNKSTQGVHKQACFTVSKGLLNGMDMENERFAAPRSHDGKSGIACIKNIQGALLRIVQLGFTQERTYQCSAKNPQDRPWHIPAT